jgi:hypothetical protein
MAEIIDFVAARLSYEMRPGSYSWRHDKHTAVLIVGSGFGGLAVALEPTGR